MSKCCTLSALNIKLYILNVALFAHLFFDSVTSHTICTAAEFIFTLVICRIGNEKTCRVFSLHFLQRTGMEHKAHTLLSHGE